MSESMSGIEKLKEKVDELYQLERPGRDDWAGWLHEKHLFEVVAEAEKLSQRFGAKKDLAMAAGMLHDVADAVMSRFDEEHEEESLKIAKELLEEVGFSEREITVVVYDAIKFHGCHDGKTPQSLEGRVMATADALAHIKTDYYKIAIGKMKEEKRPAEKIKEWALSKIERDFNEKILFEEVREETKVDYEKLKSELLQEFS